MTINITSVNDPPTSDDPRLRVLAGGIWNPILLPDFQFSDANDAPQNGLAAVIVLSLPSLGTLYDNGAPIAAASLPFVVSYNDIRSRRQITASVHYKPERAGIHKCFARD